jgi:hypothetical protein
VLVCGPTAPAQEPGPTLQLGGVYPRGVRNSATESWGTYDLELGNLTDTDRRARALAFFEGQPDMQYGRDFWLPARSTLRTWMLVGPAPPQPFGNKREIQVLLYDRTDGKNRLILPPDEERVRSRAVFYRKREPTTAVLLDPPTDPRPVYGRLPQPESPASEVVRLVRTFRLARELSSAVLTLPTGPLPASPEAFAGVDHIVIASARARDDPAGMRALRRWLQRGGCVWVMLDRVEPEVVAPLLGDALDFQVVDRVSLTTFQVEAGPAAFVRPHPVVQEHERAVEMVRVLLPAHDQPHHLVNGWPASFTRQVGRGTVVFSTLGPRGWFTPRTPRDLRSPFEGFPDIPVPTDHLFRLAHLVQPLGDREFYPPETFRQALKEEIGYSVPGRGTVGLVFGAYLFATLALLALLLRRSRRPELLGLTAPAAALLATLTFVALGGLSRGAVGPMVAVGQIVAPVPGNDEAEVEGLLAVYRPESGPAPVAGREGSLELDLGGTEGRAHRWMLTDLDSWHWENLSLPAGIRFGTFRYTAMTGGPIAAVARFGPRGIEGSVSMGSCSGVGDALLRMPGNRNLSVRVGADGTLRAGSRDFLPEGKFLAPALLTDRQQRRQELYRKFMPRLETGRRETRLLLLAWADPLDLPFTLADDSQQVGEALLVLPLRLERTPPGSRVTVPASLVAVQRLRDGRPTPLTRQARMVTEMPLRFQLPAQVLPLDVQSATLFARIEAPHRQVTITSEVGGPAGKRARDTVVLHRVQNPIDPIRIEITDKRVLSLDEQGGLHLNVALGDVLQRGQAAKDANQDDKWTIHYLELEVTGRTRSNAE